MSKATKVSIIVAACLVVAGAAILAVSAAANGVGVLGSGLDNYTENTYEPGGGFDNISIDTRITDIEFAPSDDGKCRIVCLENEKLRHYADVSDGTLSVISADNRQWYERLLFSFSHPRMTVYLPEKEYKDLLIRTETGNIKLPAGFTFGDIEIDGSTADVSCAAWASQDIKVSLSTGNIVLENISAANAELSASTGNIVLTDVIASGKLNVNSGTGDVRIERSDAKEISVKTSTGSVTGTLLSEKVFNAETSTGDVSVPKTASGGRCDISTSTGDIRIQIADK